VRSAVSARPDEGLEIIDPDPDGVADPHVPERAPVAKAIDRGWVDPEPFSYLADGEEPHTTTAERRERRALVSTLVSSFGVLRGSAERRAKNSSASRCFRSEEYGT
jgi:hypothetical protein